jgi:sec-independent protein translocase protein TatA
MLGSLSPSHWLVILAVALLLFGGRGKISAVMGDIAKGLRSFKGIMSSEMNAASTFSARRSNVVED